MSAFNAAVVVKWAPTSRGMFPTARGSKAIVKCFVWRAVVCEGERAREVVGRQEPHLARALGTAWSIS